MTLKQLRRSAHEKLINHGGISSPELDADLIIMHILGLTKAELLARDTAISDAAAIEVNAAVNRRMSGMPVQYITGRTEFMSLEFEVNKNVLIPRQETEVLVEAMITKYRNAAEPIKILDIGCGSGCVGLSLAHYLPHASVTCLDVSEKALRTAKRNAERHRLSARVEFKQGDIRDEELCAEITAAGYDCIVSNPPYIPTDDVLDLMPEVADFEPIIALDGGEDGLDFYRIIIEKTAPKRGGITAFEVGIGEADDVAAMLYSRGYSQIEIIPDLAKIDRVVLGVF